MPKTTSIDYGLIKVQIDRMLTAVPNKLEREWHAQAPTNAAFLVVLGTATMAGNTFKTIQFLCVETPLDYRHRPEMILAVPPLARTILDSLYTFVFLFEDLSSRADWYMRSGWRELFEYLERADRDYGSQTDWAEFLPQAHDSLQKIGWMIGAPEDQLRKAEWWPTPPKMIGKIKQLQNVAFLGYLRDWYYREFSQISHGTLPGMIYTVGPLRDMEGGDSAKVEQLRSNHFLQVVMVLMALYSEIEAELKIGIATDLRYVWRVLQEYSPFAAEIYNRREYARRLG